jgi:RNA polymerase sigma-70 factor (ECF subfamily)
MPLAEPDEALMVQVAAGDRAACEELVERHLGRTLALATRMVKDRAAAEDIAQEVFTRLWVHAKRWQPTARLSTWLYRVAYNLCLDYAARRREELVGEVPEALDRESDVGKLMERRDLQHHVAAALATLPDTQQAAVTLCYYQGLRNAEAADVLGVSVDALESLLARARRVLRQRLGSVAADLLEEM